MHIHGPSDLQTTSLKIKVTKWDFRSDAIEEPILVPQRTF